MNEKDKSYMWNVQRKLEELEGTSEEPTIFHQDTTNINHYEYEGTRDILLQCCGRTWGTSRAVLSQGCKVFRKMLNNQFREGKEGTINLSDDDPEGIRSLLVHLCDPETTYNTAFCYPPPISLPPSALKGWWLRHLNIFRIAEKYRVASLRDWAESCVLELFDRMRIHPVTGWEHLVRAVLDLPETGAVKIRAAALRHLSNYGQRDHRSLMEVMRVFGVEEMGDFDVVGETIEVYEDELKEERRKYEELLRVQDTRQKRIVELSRTVQQLKGVARGLPKSVLQMQVEGMFARYASE